MDNFIQEVDEELRRERYLTLWRKYGRLAVACALMVVIGVAAGIGWRNYRANLRAEAGLAYAMAVEAAAQGRSEEALAAFRELKADAPAGYAELARLQEAARLSEQGNQAAAAELYDAMAKESSIAQPFRDVALLLYALAVLDRADPSALAQRLEPLTAAENPWRFSALELTALLARKRGDGAAAAEIFRRLADDPATPPAIRARAAEFLALSGA